jgi:hypothetical protein
MKPPNTPSRFRAPVRHYHRHTPSQGSSWDAWVGEEQKSKSRFLIPVVSIVIFLLISALLVIGYAMVT